MTNIRIDKISAINSHETNPYENWSKDYEDIVSNSELPLDPPAQPDTHAAEEEVVSLYYLNTLQSLQPQEPQKNLEENQKIKAVERAQKVELSTVQKIKNWLFSLFRANSTNVVSEVDPTSETEEIDLLPDSSSPILPPYQDLEQKRLEKAVAELNQALTLREKDSIEFEEELRKSSKKFDKLAFLHFIEMGMKQKKLKEVASIEIQEELFHIHQKNKDLHEEHFSLSKEIATQNKASKILGWVNLGSTVGIAGMVAFVFFSGGAGGVFSIAIPLASLFKGTVSVSEAILKGKNDKNKGTLFFVNETIRSNNAKINDQLEGMNLSNEEISRLCKQIRKQLEYENSTMRKIIR